MLYLGIDQHAKQLTVNLRNSLGDVILRRQVSTRPEKVLEFFEQITARCAQANGGFQAILEVCGFNDWLIEMLKNFRCDRIVLVQPEDSSRRKTDKRDGPSSASCCGSSATESPTENRSTNSKSSTFPQPS